MEDEKVYHQEVIDENPFPNEVAEDFSATQKTSNDTYNAETIKPQSFPTKKIAYEVLGSVLNTRSKKILAEFQFTESGAIRIGKYQAGISGDISISPNGIVARNSAGINTIAIDGDTGDATFAGTIQAGTLVSGQIIVGNNTWIIDGDPNFPRIALLNNGVVEILIGEV